MEDWQYFLCLIGMIVCAIGSPIYCVRTLKKAKVSWAIIASLCIILGATLSLPWGNTRELLWLSLGAQVYFGTVLLSTLLYGLGKLPKAKEKD